MKECTEFIAMKDFGLVKKGDVFTKDDYDMYTVTDLSAGDARIISVDSNTLTKWIEEEMVAPYDEGCSKCCKSCKISEAIDEIDTLLEQYKKDHEAVTEAYNEQEIPACVKVEADTVYFNMNKILNHIRGILAD